MEQKDFEALIMKSEFFAQIMAELTARLEQHRQATQDALAMIATAAARQMDGAVFAQNIERMERLFDQEAPNAMRSEMLHHVAGLVKNSAIPRSRDPSASH